MNKKVLFLFTLTLCMVISQCSYAFSDIEGHWAEETIEKASQYKIINGYEDNTFRPEDFMTRAELITVIDKLLGLESETDKYIADINSKDWYYSNMKKAVFFGILQGDEKGNVQPNEFVTREEAIVLLTRAFRMDTGNTVLSNFFEDSDEIARWARKECILFTMKIRLIILFCLQMITN